MRNGYNEETCVDGGRGADLRHYARFWLQARIPVIRQGYGENQDGTPEGSKQDINMGEESILHLLPPLPSLSLPPPPPLAGRHPLCN